MKTLAKYLHLLISAWPSAHAEVSMSMDQIMEYINTLPTQLQLPEERDGALTNISCGLSRAMIEKNQLQAKQALVKLPRNLTSDSQYEIRVSWKGIFPIKFHWRWACAYAAEGDEGETNRFINKTFDQIADHPDEKIVFRTDGNGLVNSGKSCDENQEMGLALDVAFEGALPVRNKPVKDPLQDCAFNLQLFRHVVQGVPEFLLPLIGILAPLCLMAGWGLQRLILMTADSCAQHAHRD